MTNNQKEKSPDKIMLRKFGFIFGGIVVAIFGLAIPLLLDKPLPLWPWYIMAAMCFFALAWPASLIVIYKPWMKFGAVAGWINTRIILFILFYGIITPTALIRRLFNSDPLKKKFDPDCVSYRITNTPQSNDHMEHPY